MPKPKAGETRKDFMIRCIPEVIKEGKSKEQAVAICSSYYEKKDTWLHSNINNIIVYTYMVTYNIDNLFY